MKRLILVLSSGFLFLGCGKPTDLLQKPPPPPPVIAKIEATTTTTTTTSTTTSSTTTTSTTTTTTLPKPFVSTVYKLEQSSFETRGSEVDIVWIIDNSGSMDKYQQQVIKNTSEFIQNFTADSRLHWKMGLISTDVSQVPYVGFTEADKLDWNTADATTKFQAAVGRLGTGGSIDEQSFAPFAKHITAFPNFLRPNAHLAIIMVSDEPEFSSNYTAQSFYSFLTGLKGENASKVLTYGVFPLPTATGSCGYSYRPGDKYYDFMEISHGKAFDLCAANFGPNLAAMGEDLVNHLTVLNPVIPVEHAADLKTISVSHKGKVLKQGFLAEGGQWIYDIATNTIRILDPSILEASDPYFTVTYQVQTGP